MGKTKTRTGWVGFGGGFAGLDTGSGRYILFFSGTGTGTGSGSSNTRPFTRTRIPEFVPVFFANLYKVLICFDLLTLYNFFFLLYSLIAYILVITNY